MEELLNVDLYTDGACSYNPGPGGWGYLLICESKNKEKYDSGYKEHTTNNEMELTAVIEGIKAIKKPCNLTIYTDSAYVSNAFLQDWISSWKNNGFRNSNKKEIAEGTTFETTTNSTTRVELTITTETSSVYTKSVSFNRLSDAGTEYRENFSG